jgi:CheY-like chemotaxis protein
MYTPGFFSQIPFWQWFMEIKSRFVVRDVTLLGSLGGCVREIDLILRELDQSSERLIDKHSGLADAINSCADFLQGFLYHECGIEVCSLYDTEAENDRMGSAVRRLLSLSKLPRIPSAERVGLLSDLNLIAKRFDALVFEFSERGFTPAAQALAEQIRSELQNLESQLGDQNANPTVQRQRIVLIEDNSDERILLTEFLQKKGCVIRSFADGEEAVQFILEEQTDAIVLLDMNLPHFHGAKVVELIRSNPASKQIQIIGMSGASLNDNDVTLGPDGVDFWLRKPFNPNAILDFIESRSGA